MLPYFRDPFVFVQHLMDRFPKPEPAVIVGGIPYVRVTQQEEVGAEEGSGDSVVYRSKYFFVVHGYDGTLCRHQNSTLQDILDVGMK